MGVAFSILVTIVILGFLWFWIVRPILEDYNLIAPRESVNDYQLTVEFAPPVMSRSEDSTLVRSEVKPVHDSGSTGSGDPVRAHQYQVEPSEPAAIEPAREPLILHNLSRAALIALLSVQKNDSNGYRFSKNQIATFVGGTKADVLKEIDLYRDPPPLKPQPTARRDRPINGWGN